MSTSKTTSKSTHKTVKKLTTKIAADQKSKPKDLKVMGVDVAKKGKDRTAVAHLNCASGEHVTIGGVTIINNNRARQKRIKAEDVAWREYVRDHSSQPSALKHF